MLVPMNRYIIYRENEGQIPVEMQRNVLQGGAERTNPSVSAVKCPSKVAMKDKMPV